MAPVSRKAASPWQHPKEKSLASLYSSLGSLRVPPLAQSSQEPESKERSWRSIVVSLPGTLQGREGDQSDLERQEFSPEETQLKEHDDLPLLMPSSRSGTLRIP